MTTILKKNGLLLMIVPYILLVVYMAIADFFNFNLTVIMSFLLLPYVWLTAPSQQISYRWFWIVIVLLLLCWHLSVITLYYWLVIAGLIFTVESLKTRLTILPITLLFVMSMVFRYLSEVFTFPIRIWLSKCVGNVLQFFHFDIKIEGNNVIVNGNDFVVEPACMGLDMIGISLLMAIFLLAFYQRKSKKTISDFGILLMLGLTFGLNILNNFFRIILLIILRIAPENPQHEIVGLLCFVAYVCLPILLIIPKVYEKLGRNSSFCNSSAPLKLTPIVLHLILSISIGITVVYRMGEIKNQQENISKNSLEQFNVKQIRNEHSLVYIKTIPAFYSIEHNPLFCWRGSGYDLKNISENTINHHKYYQGVLTKGNQKLLTAWWFTNDKVLTNSQLEWRWYSFIGNSSFKLINITAESEKELHQAILQQM
jgi:exosortase N